MLSTQNQLYKIIMQLHKMSLKKLYFLNPLILRYGEMFRKIYSTIHINRENERRSLFLYIAKVFT